MEGRSESPLVVFNKIKSLLINKGFVYIEESRRSNKVFSFIGDSNNYLVYNSDKPSVHFAGEVLRTNFYLAGAIVSAATDLMLSRGQINEYGLFRNLLLTPPEFWEFIQNNDSIEGHRDLMRTFEPRQFINENHKNFVDTMEGLEFTKDNVDNFMEIALVNHGEMLSLDSITELKEAFIFVKYFAASETAFGETASEHAMVYRFDVSSGYLKCLNKFDVPIFGTALMTIAGASVIHLNNIT